MFRKNSLLVVLVCFSTLLARAAGDGDLEAFPELLEQLSRDYDPVTSTSCDALVPAMESIRKSEGLAAAVDLWRNGQRGLVELAWWRTPYRTTRLMVLALFYAQYEDRDVSFFPRFVSDAERFEPRERQQRLAEISFIENNLPLIQKKMRAFHIPQRAVPAVRLEGSRLAN